MKLDKEKYQEVEGKADKLVARLRESGFTAIILISAALLIIGLILT